MLIIDGEVWITVKELAEIWGKSERTIKRWIKQNKYNWSIRVEEINKGTIKKRYLISLSSLPHQVQRRFWLRNKKDREREIEKIIRSDEKEFKKKVYEEYMKLICEGLKKSYAVKKTAEKYKISERTVYRYIEEVETDMIRDNMIRKTPKLPYAWSSEALSYALSLYLNRKAPSLTEVYKVVCDVAKEKGWAIGSYSSLARFVNKNISPALITYARMGEKALKRMFMPKKERNWELLSLNEIWCADHTQLNILAKTRDGRVITPWITAIQDLASGAIVGFCLCERPSSDSIAAAFRHAVLPKEKFRWRIESPALKEEEMLIKFFQEDEESVNFFWPMYGLPDELYIDNGKDYRSKRFWDKEDFSKEELVIGKIDVNVKDFDKLNVRIITPKGAFTSLGISPIFAQPYHAWSKRIESVFSQLQRFLRYFPCSWKKSTPKGDREIQRVKNELRKGLVLTMEELRGIIEFWVVYIWNANPHGKHRKGDKKTPNDIWLEKLKEAQERGEGVRVVSKRALDFALMKHTERVITDKGISMWNMRYEPDVETAIKYTGKRVEVRYDPNDITKLYLFYEGKFVGYALLREPFEHPRDEKALKAHIRRQRKFMKILKQELLKYSADLKGFSFMSHFANVDDRETDSEEIKGKTRFEDAEKIEENIERKNKNILDNPWINWMIKKYYEESHEDE